MSFIVQVSINEIERNFPAYLQRVEAGESLVIVKSGICFDFYSELKSKLHRPIVEIKPVVSDSKRLRPFGLCAGEFTVPDDFDEPLPDDIIQEFEK